MVQKGTPLGEYMRNQRLAANLSLREAAALVGVTHVFLGEVERGRKPLPRERWDAIVRAMPTITLRDLEELTAHEGAKMQLTLRQAGPRYETIGDLLLRRAKKQDIPDPQLDELIRLLKGDQ